MNIDFFLDALGNIKPEFVEEAEFGALPQKRKPKTGGKRKSISSYRAFAAGAAVILLAGASFRLYFWGMQERSKEYENSADNCGYHEMAQITPEDAAEKSGDVSASQEERTEETTGEGTASAKEDRIFINESDKTESSVKRQTAEDGIFSLAGFAELSEYYGTELLLKELPQDLSYQSLCEAQFGFFYGETGELISDVNTLVFENESGSRRVLLSLSKLIQAEETEEGEMPVSNETSVIYGQEVLIFHCTGETGTDIYRAEFAKDGNFYLLTGEGLTEEEMVSVITGCVKP